MIVTLVLIGIGLAVSFVLTGSNSDEINGLRDKALARKEVVDRAYKRLTRLDKSVGDNLRDTEQQLDEILFQLQMSDDYVKAQLKGLDQEMAKIKKKARIK